MHHHKLCFNILNISKEGGVITLYARIISEYKRLENQIHSIKEKLLKLPPGKLICCNHKNYSKWYQSDGHYKSYIPKPNQSLAEQLAQKKYLSLQLEDLENEKRALEFYLHHHAPTGKAEKLLTEPSEYQKLLSPFFSPLSKELSDWMHTPYERNMHHSENLIYKSITGNTVRSKSELLIDMFLHTRNIPFRYENALQLGDTTIYPDFTIRHPLNGDYFYWEHFGLMDNTSYIDNACSKLRLYASHGIVPGIHLITTYETKDNPLSTEAIEKLIEYYFL